MDISNFLNLFVSRSSSESDRHSISMQSMRGITLCAASSQMNANPAQLKHDADNTSFSYFVFGPVTTNPYRINIDPEFLLVFQVSFRSGTASARSLSSILRLLRNVYVNKVSCTHTPEYAVYTLLGDVPFATDLVRMHCVAARRTRLCLEMCNSNTNNAAVDDASMVEVEYRTQQPLQQLGYATQPTLGFHDRYALHTQINEGGYGTIWSLKHDRTKCVKIMDLDEGDPTARDKKRKCVLREFEFTRRALNNAQMSCELYLDEAEARAYLVMPFFRGTDLFDCIDNEQHERPLSIPMVLRIFYSILLKLYDLHYEKFMIHGDLKPENIILLHDCDGVDVELIDYGIAKSLRHLSADDRFLQTKGHFGTTGYVAPELYRHKKYNRKVDVWSAGVVLYNLLSKCMLFGHDDHYYSMDHATYGKFLQKRLKCLRQHPLVVDMLHSCLALDPSERLSVPQLLATYFESGLAFDSHSQSDETEEENTSPMPTSSSCTVSDLDLPGDSDGDLVFCDEWVRLWTWSASKHQWHSIGCGTLRMLMHDTDGALVLFQDVRDKKVQCLRQGHGQGHSQCRLVNDTEVQWCQASSMVCWNARFNSKLNAQQFVSAFNE